MATLQVPVCSCNQSRLHDTFVYVAQALAKTRWGQMATKPSLTDHEKRVVKALTLGGERNQDIHLLVNIGRNPSINFGRVSGAKDWDIEPATEEEVARYRFEKSLVDLKTGLSPFADERLVRAREAMLVAVQTFNNPLLHFKPELFAVISNIAWTYLLHEYYERREVPILNEDGFTFALSQMLDREDCPLVLDVRKNLKAVKLIRDKAEHKLLNSLGRTFYPLFQANCLNFDSALIALFGPQVALGDSLTYSLQFSALSMEQISLIQRYDLNQEIETISQEIDRTLGIDGREGTSYQFKVNFSLQKSTKGEANFVFTRTNPAAPVHNVLVEKVASDEIWPHKPAAVTRTVAERTGKRFTSHHHTLAWKRFRVRPQGGAEKPHACDRRYCTYHIAHGDYTYSNEWIELLVHLVADEEQFNELIDYGKF
jgi:hypothetical protein